MFWWTKETAVVFWATLAVIIAICVGVYFLLRHKEKKYKLIPFYCIAVALVVVEIIHQIGCINDGYEASNLPLQFCYFFTIWPLLVLCTRGKTQDAFYKISCLWSLTIFVCMLVNPVMIYGDSAEALFYHGQFEYNYIFHELIVLYFVMGLFLRPTKFELKDWKFALLSLGIYLAFAMPCAYIFNVNFCNILVCQFSTLIESLRVNCGQVLYNIVYACMGVGLISVVFFIYYFLTKINFHKKNNKKIIIK